MQHIQTTLKSISKLFKKNSTLSERIVYCPPLHIFLMEKSQVQNFPKNYFMYFLFKNRLKCIYFVGKFSDKNLCC